MEQPNTTNESTDSDDARAGYSGAITLWTQEGAQVWAKFTAMVYAHTVVILTIGVLLNAPRAPDFKLFRIVLCLLGILLCIAWALISRRSFQYLDYYIRSAREIKEQHLIRTVRVVSRAAELFTKEIRFVGQKPISIQPCLLNQPIRRMIYFVIAAFVVLYVFAIAQP